MTDTTINGLSTALAATAAADDLLVIWDTSASATKKHAAAYLARSDGSSGNKLITGSGRELTVAATGTAALLGTAQTFTATQTVSGVAVNLARSGAELANFYATVGGTLLGQLYNSGLVFYAQDLGVGAAGCALVAGANSNGTQGGAGFVTMGSRTAVGYRIWPDASGNLRINTGDPTYANDTAGTVVGTQPASLDSKNVQPGITNIEAVLERIAIGAGAVRRFVYKSGAFGGEEFEGVVVDYAAAYGMDRDEAHPAGKSLNEINILGDLLRAVAYLSERVAALEAQLAQ